MTDLQFTSEITVELIRSMANDSMVAQAARVSTAGAHVDTDKPISGLVRALMREKHGSPFEHNSFTFRVHMPKDVALEHMRHRIGWSYNGQSGRYMKMEPVFYVPPAKRPLVQVGKPMDYELLPGTDGQHALMVAGQQSAARASWEQYEAQLDAGIAREVARRVLGDSLMVTYYTTCNARSLMAFLSLRTEDELASFPSKPLWEIQQVAHGYEEALAVHMPLTHSAYNDYGRVAP